MSGSVLSSVHAGSVPDEQWRPQPESDAPIGSQGILIDENIIGGIRASNYEHMNFDSTGRVTEVFACKSTTDSRCAMKPGSIEWVLSNMPWCQNSADTDCVEEVSATDEAGKNLQVNRLESFPKTGLDYFTGNPDLLLPSGGGNLIVDIPEAPHQGGTKYLVRVMTQSNRETEGPFSADGTSAAIFAIDFRPGSFQEDLLNTDISQYDIGPKSIGGGTAAASGCIAASTDECAEANPIPSNITFGLKYRLSRQLQGWFHGRIKSPDIQFTTSPKGTRVSARGNAIKVPTNYVMVPTKILSKELLNFYQLHDFWSGGTFRPNAIGSAQWKPITADEKNLESLLNLNFKHQPVRFDETAMQEYLLWLPYLKETASALPTQWTFRTMISSRNDQLVNKCSANTNGVSGLVSTNAAMYIDGPPTFNSQAGTIEYKVASTHFEPDGKSVFNGTYDLVMNAKVARCLYGFTSAPIKANVSVVSADGKDSVASSVIREENGFLYFAAYGFTYSNPTIKIKLTQDGVSGNKKSQNKQIFITCTKGTSTKKITGLKPVCPKGYKNKS